MRWTPEAALLRKLSIDVDMGSADRDMLTAFLSQGQVEGYSPKSGQIRRACASGRLAAVEEQAIKDFEALSLAKADQQLAAALPGGFCGASGLGGVPQEGLQVHGARHVLEFLTLCEEKEINTLTASIESKLEKSGQLGVEIVALKALELFKKTLPSPALLQTQVSAKKARAAALQLLDAAPGRSLRLVALALRGGASSFEKVIKMIDDMVALLIKEQSADDEKKAYCEKELDVSDDEKKVLEQTIGDLEKTISDAKETIETLSDEIAALLKGPLGDGRSSERDDRSR
ncbi:unnamed protein product [Prorocentrum cordatum]|uniref:Uncharacterized protein n=1 Tax=Prorocentrum cordatum TaxID=2364126 RepID=A0ABN9VL35_9DINO|nr:unnamed protein product [Polarella glacialis]